MDSATLPQHLTDNEVGSLLGISRASVWRWAKSGRIPQPRKIGENTTRWDGLEVAELARNAPTTSDQDRARGRARAMAGRGKAA